MTPVIHRTAIRTGAGTGRRPVRAGGFTLVEVVISSALMSLIMISAYLCFSASVATRKTIEPRLEALQNARVAMALMAADLRAACLLDKETHFLGMRRTLGGQVADNLDFATHNYSPRQEAEGDFCQVSYFIEPDEETGALSLWRRRNPVIALNPLSGGAREEIARNVLRLQFEYFDGWDWYDTWGDVSGRGKAETSQRSQPNLTGMPEAVRITLWIDSDPRKKTSASGDTTAAAAPAVFETVARLNLAGATTSTTSSAGASDAGGQNAPANRGAGGAGG